MSNVIDEVIKHQLETRAARLSYELGCARRSQAYWYERARTLENAIRKANSFEAHEDRSAALALIARRVLVKPRPKWSSRGRR